MTGVGSCLKIVVFIKRDVSILKNYRFCRAFVLYSPYNQSSSTSDTSHIHKPPYRRRRDPASLGRFQRHNKIRLSRRELSEAITSGETFSTKTPARGFGVVYAGRLSVHRRIEDVQIVLEPTGVEPHELPL